MTKRNKILLLVQLILIVVALNINIWIGLGVIFGFHLFILYGLLSPNSKILGTPACHFKTFKRQVWLTIDDGPDKKITPEILNLLSRYKATATFFIIGKRGKKNIKLLEQIISCGHELANHTHNHRKELFWGLFPKTLNREILQCEDLLTNIRHNKPSKLFRPPVGFGNLFLEGILQKNNLQHIGWSARGFDGKSSSRFDIQNIANQITQNIKPGSIILLHDSQPTSLEVLQRLLVWLAKNNYQTTIPCKSALIKAKANISLSD